MTTATQLVVIHVIYYKLMSEPAERCIFFRSVMPEKYAWFSRFTHQFRIQHILIP